MEPQSIYTTEYQIKQLVSIFCQSGAVKALPRAIELYLENATRIGDVSVEVEPSNVFTFEKVRVQELG